MNEKPDSMKKQEVIDTWRGLADDMPLKPCMIAYKVRDKVTNVHIATVGAVDRYFEGQAGEHARIMAAAPELLRACIAALAIVLREQPDGSIADDMIKAIRKAEGKD
jgi:hypothetical protein